MTVNSSIEKAADAIVSARNSDKLKADHAAAGKSLKSAVKFAVEKVDAQYGIIDTPKTPGSIVKTIKNDIKTAPFIAGITHSFAGGGTVLLGSAVTYFGLYFGVSPYAIPEILGPIAVYSGVSTMIGFSGLMAISTTGTNLSDKEKDVATNIMGGYGKILAAPIAAPLTYLKRAIKYQNFDPRLWRSNSKEAADIILKEDKNYLIENSNVDYKNLVSLYLEDGMSEKVAAGLGSAMNTYMQDKGVRKHAAERPAIPHLLEGMLLDPAENSAGLLAQSIPFAYALPGVDGKAGAGTNYYALESEMPDVAAAREKITLESVAFEQEKIGLQIITMFGTSAAIDAAEASGAIHRWHTHQNQVLPPSLLLMEKIVDNANNLRGHIAAQDEANLPAKKGLRGMFTRKTTSDQAELYSLAGQIMRQTEGLSSVLKSDLARFDQSMQDNDKAQDILSAHADILRAYSESFNAAATGLKKLTSMEIAGKKIVRFTPATVQETKINLALTAQRAEQEQATYEHVHQPLQEYLAHSLPSLARNGADVLKAVEQVYRVARWKEFVSVAEKIKGKTLNLSDISLGISESDVKNFMDLNEATQSNVMQSALNSLDAAIQPWQEKISEMKEIAQIEDFRGKRLMITDQSEQNGGQKAIIVDVDRTAELVPA